MYIYLQANRVNILQVWLATGGQEETNNVLVIQHCDIQFCQMTKYLPGGRLQGRTENK